MNNTGWSTSSFNATSYAENQISQRAGSRKAAGTISDGVVNGGFFGIGRNEYSVVGINVNQIDKMRTAIREYVKNIEQHLSGIEPLASADNAFKSEEVQNAVSNYISKVKDYCINLTTQLLAFSDKLVDVKNAYEQSMSKLSGDIGAQNSAFSEGSRYQEQMQ